MGRRWCPRKAKTNNVKRPTISKKNAEEENFLLCCLLGSKSLRFIFCRSSTEEDEENKNQADLSLRSNGSVRSPWKLEADPFFSSDLCERSNVQVQVRVQMLGYIQIHTQLYTKDVQRKREEKNYTSESLVAKAQDRWAWRWINQQNRGKERERMNEWICN